MPRTSKKDQVLAAALDVIEREGVQALTYESLAATTGMSKSGLIYHFPSRHDMLADCHRYCAARWEAQLERLAGGRAEELTTVQRQRALVLSMGGNDPLIELLMSLHAREHPDYAAPWDAVETRWMRPSEDGTGSQDPMSVQLVVLLCTGLWVHDHLSSHKLDDAVRRRIVAMLLERIESDQPLQI